MPQTTDGPSASEAEDAERHERRAMAGLDREERR
jgi:hypothetical protein